MVWAALLRWQTQQASSRRPIRWGSQRTPGTSRTAEEFGNARENYYTEGERIAGEWHGRLREEHFKRLSEGRHPTTGEQLVRCQAARECTNEQGEKIKTMEQRPAGTRHMNSRPQWESIPGRTRSAE